MTSPTPTPSVWVNTTALNVTQGDPPFSSDDASWALTNSFLILTMQTGFAMLECGCVSAKNMANIMIKNVCDVSIGGLAFWSVGYALIFGKPSNWFCGYGDFFFSVADPATLGERYAHYFFQFSFASTATTIVSGAIAERMKLPAYMIFSFVNVIIYCLPAFWAWGDKGFLANMGFFDFAGVCCVHLNGGASAFIAALILGPRSERFSKPDKYAMNSPITALTGMFMLTWAWLGFNCGSTFRITPNYWKICALVSVTTLNGAIGGGIVGLAISLIVKRGKIDVSYTVNSVLGGLVAVTGGCPLFEPWTSLIIGGIGAAIAIGGQELTMLLKIDDPVGAVAVHFFSGLWGTIAVGLFAKNNFLEMAQFDGLFYGGGWKFLGVNTLGALVTAGFSALSTGLFMLLMKYTIGIRVSAEEEAAGADFCEHDIKPIGFNQRLEELIRQMEESGADNVNIKELQEIASAEAAANDHGPKLGPLSIPNQAAAAQGVDVKTLATMAKTHIDEIKKHQTMLNTLKGVASGMKIDSAKTDGFQSFGPKTGFFKPRKISPDS